MALHSLNLFAAYACQGFKDPDPKLDKAKWYHYVEDAYGVDERDQEPLKDAARDYLTFGEGNQYPGRTDSDGFVERVTEAVGTSHR